MNIAHDGGKVLTSSKKYKFFLSPAMSYIFSNFMQMPLFLQTAVNRLHG